MEYIDKYVWYQEGPGVRKNQYTNKGIKLLNVANLVDGKLNLSTSKRYISVEEAYGKYKHFLVDEGDLIIASSGIQVDYFNKKMGFAKKEHLPLCMNTSTIRFKVKNKEEMDIRYFMYFLKSNIFKDQLSKLITGSAQLNFGPSHLKKVKINNIPMKDQITLINKISKVEEIIEIRKNEIKYLNDLVKSQFVEMFKYEINTKKIKELSSYFSRGKSPNYVEKSEIKVINQACIYWNNFRLENVKYQDETKIKRSLDKLIKYNDVLITSTGTGTLGRCNVFKISNDKYLADGHVSILRFITDQINPLYFKYYFMQDKIQEKLYSDCVNGSTNQIELSKDKFQNFDIIVPSIELQNKFAQIVEQIDKQKFEIEKSLKKMEDLYESLMNKYFG